MGGGQGRRACARATSSPSARAIRAASSAIASASSSPSRCRTPERLAQSRGASWPSVRKAVQEGMGLTLDDVVALAAGRAAEDLERQAAAREDARALRDRRAAGPHGARATRASSTSRSTRRRASSATSSSPSSAAPQEAGLRPRRATSLRPSDCLQLGIVLTTVRPPMDGRCRRARDRDAARPEARGAEAHPAAHRDRASSSPTTQSHPTAQELFERLRPAFPSMSFATVYNTLDALARAGLARHAAPRKRATPRASIRTRAPHHHAVCDRCGAVRRHRRRARSRRRQRRREASAGARARLLGPRRRADLPRPLRECARARSAQRRNRHARRRTITWPSRSTEPRPTRT